MELRRLALATAPALPPLMSRSSTPGDDVVSEDGDSEEEELARSCCPRCGIQAWSSESPLGVNMLSPSSSSSSSSVTDIIDKDDEFIDCSVSIPNLLATDMLKRSAKTDKLLRFLFLFGGGPATTTERFGGVADIGVAFGGGESPRDEGVNEGVKHNACEGLPRGSPKPLKEVKRSGLTRGKP